VLIDHRTYIIKHGMMQAHIALYQAYGNRAQVRHLGKPLAYTISESGELNAVVHLWGYEDAADRARRRAALQADPEWQDYLKRSAEAGYVVSQRNSLLTPVAVDQAIKPA
jgi:hypothetical protein